MIMLGSVVLAGFAIAALTGIGLFGADYTGNPLEIFSALVTYGFPYLAVLAIGGLAYLAALTITGSRRRRSALMFAPVAALPGLAVAFVGPGATAANITAPLLFAAILAFAVRLPQPQPGH